MRTLSQSLQFPFDLVCTILQLFPLLPLGLVLLRLLQHLVPDLSHRLVHRLDQFERGYLSPLKNLSEVIAPTFVILGRLTTLGLHKISWQSTDSRHSQHEPGMSTTPLVARQPL